jgi:hypothetical protein
MPVPSEAGLPAAGGRIAKVRSNEVEARFMGVSRKVATLAERD